MNEETYSLSQRECKPCQGGVPPLAGEALEKLATELGNNWQVIDGHHLEKEYPFKNFAEALAFTNKVGALAEEIFHHPDIFLAWGKVKVTIWTHKIDGLNEADFIFAAKADALV
jgi:4a-hydroxytetrahydrobiopterin dehydratase